MGRKIINQIINKNYKYHFKRSAPIYPQEILSKILSKNFKSNFKSRSDAHHPLGIAVLLLDYSLQQTEPPLAMAEQPYHGTDSEGHEDEVAKPQAHLLVPGQLGRHPLLHGVGHRDGITARDVGRVTHQAVTVLSVPTLLYGVDGIALGVAVDEYGITEDDAVALLMDEAHGVTMYLRHRDIACRGAAV